MNRVNETHSQPPSGDILASMPIWNYTGQDRIGPCARQRVVAIIADANQRVLGIGENTCANAQRRCPMRSPEDAALCADICGRVGDAEVIALQEALGRGHDTRGAVCYVFGSAKVSDTVREHLEAAGCTVQPLGAQECG